MVFNEGRELPSIAVLGNSHVIGAVFTGLCDVPATVLLQHVPRCYDRICLLVHLAIPGDQGYEQNNAYIKTDGEAVGLTDCPSALQRWMVAGPEVAAVIEDFEDAHQLMDRLDEVLHYDQRARVHNAFRNHVCSFVNVMEELGNPFEVDNEELLVLDSKEIADPSAVDAVKKAQKIGQQQFQIFTKECLVEKTNPIDDTIHRNRLKVFVGSTTKTVS